MKSDPELNDLRVFREVAETGSFSRAAQQLQVPVSTLSRRMRAFEDALGSTLLLRSTRRVSLTEAGQQLLERVAGPLSLVEEGLAEVRSGSGALRGRLRLSTSVTFALAFLPPILKRYAALCPEVTVDVLTGHDNVDLVGESVDVALRMGRPADSDFIYRRFGRVEQRLYAASALAEAFPLSHPKDLEGAPIITHRRHLHRGQVHWSLLGGSERHVVICRPLIVLDDPVLVERVVAEGLGFGLLNDEVAKQAQAGGRLKQVLEDWKGPTTDLYYLHHPMPNIPGKILRFLEAVRTERVDG